MATRSRSSTTSVPDATCSSCARTGPAPGRSVPRAAISCLRGGRAGSRIVQVAFASFGWSEANATSRFREAGMMRAQPVGSHFVDGKFVDGDGPEFDSIHPADGSVIARLRAADPAVVEQAMDAAVSGFDAWSHTPPVERGRVLLRAAEAIRERNHELSVLESLDTGKPLQETLVADAASGADCLEYFAGLVMTDTGQHIDLGRSFAYTRREPLGVCAAIGAWNYPIQIASWK